MSSQSQRCHVPGNGVIRPSCPASHVPPPGREGTNANLHFTPSLLPASSLLPPSQNCDTLPLPHCSRWHSVVWAIPRPHSKPSLEGPHHSMPICRVCLHLSVMAQTATCGHWRFGRDGSQRMNRSGLEKVGEEKYFVAKRKQEKRPRSWQVSS